MSEAFRFKSSSSIYITFKKYCLFFNEILQFLVVHPERLSICNLLGQFLYLNFIRMSIQLFLFNFLISITKPSINLSL